MEPFVKPKPNQNYFKLSSKEATLVAYRVAMEYGDGVMDWHLFREWTQAHAQRYTGKQLTLT